MFVRLCSHPDHSLTLIYKVAGTYTLTVSRLYSFCEISRRIQMRFSTRFHRHLPSAPTAGSATNIQLVQMQAHVMPLGMDGRIYGCRALIMIMCIILAAFARNFEVAQLCLSELLVFQARYRQGSSSSGLPMPIITFKMCTRYVLCVGRLSPDLAMVFLGLAARPFCLRHRRVVH